MTGVLALVTLLTAVLLAVVVAIGTRHRAEQAADLAALAAAAGFQRGVDGCAEALAIATSNGAELTGCRASGTGVVAVSVMLRVAPEVARWVPGHAVAEARAGPAAAG